MPDPNDFTFTDDEQCNRCNWRVQRVAWAATLLALIAIACGGLGNGPLAKRTLSTADQAVAFDYDAVIHNESDVDVTIRATAASTTPHAGISRVQLDEAFTRRMKVVRTVPEYGSASSIAGASVYQWNSDAPPQVVVLKMHPEQPGLLQGNILVNGSQSIDFRQICLP
jgi:hypothetical protein